MVRGIFRRTMRWCRCFRLWRGKRSKCSKQLGFEEIRSPGSMDDDMVNFSAYDAVLSHWEDLDTMYCRELDFVSGSGVHDKGIRSPGGMEDDMGNLSAYDAVESLLEDLDTMLCYHDFHFGSRNSYFSLIFKKDIQTMWHQLNCTKLLLSTDYDKQSAGILEILVAGTVCRARDHIVLKVFLKYIKDEEATSSTGTGIAAYLFTSTVLNLMHRITKREEHFVLCDGVVSLLHDLKLILSSHRCAYDSEQRLVSPFRIGDIQIMYDNLSMMDSLLVDSLGQGYDKKLMSSLGNWIHLVVDRGRDYIDSWPQSLIVKKSTCSFPSPKSIFDNQLRKLTECMEYINQELIGLTEKQPAGGTSPPPSEHIIELQRTTSADGAAQVSCPNLHQITERIEFANNRLKRIRDRRLIIQTSTQSFQGTTSTCKFDYDNISGQVVIKPNRLPRMPNKGGKLVGFQHDLSVMLDRLTGYPPNLQVLTVVGTGGIGKTAFTESLYDDPLVRHHFKTRVWLTISEQYQVDEVLISLFCGLTGDMEYIYKRSDGELIQDIRKILSGKTYLIVLDDMWDKQAWNDLKRIFPNVENGSRIMLTTRLIDVAEFASPDTQPHFLPLLSIDESWELFCSKISINDQLCPPELESIGKQIAYGAAQVSCQNLHQITKSIEFVNNQLKRIRDGTDIMQTPTQSLQGTTSTGQVFIKLNKLSRLPNEGRKLVGFENDLLEMLNRLTGYPPKLQVLPVIGMGGIGKTTFTESLYDHPLVRDQFHIRAWFTISQHYQVKEVLVGLLCCLTHPKTEIYEKSTEDLKQALYQSLKGKKYLIVLDDMWDKQAWNDLKGVFPNDKNGSRIMLTTRLIDVAEFASPDTQPYCLHRLSPDESWELLCSKIPIIELCPRELEPIGKQIACECKGLPLAIVVVAGLLSKENMTLEVWKDIAKRVCSIVMDEQEQFQNILALSYNHLPDHLKPCFLYMGIFPEDSKIPAKKLIWLWIGEGFIRPRKLESLEEVAENYLEDLIGRSLVQVNRRRYDGRFKTCFLHDMLRDLCLRESHKQHFFLVFHNDLKLMTKKEKDKFMSKCRRVCFHSNTLDTTNISSWSNTRSFMWFKTITPIDLKSHSFMNLERVKVLDIIDGQLEELPRDIVRILANLRYLALSFQNSIDRSIFSSTFHNIQILIVEGEWNGQLPKEFWTMSELRHFYLKRSFLSYWPEESRPNIMQLASASESPGTLIYPVQYEEHSIKVLQNLRSLATIRPISCTEAAFLSMLNLKKLSVFENEEDYGFRGWLKNLVHLKELQTLKYVFRDPFVWHKPDRLPSQNFILGNLINLTISGTAFPWEDMLKLCALPKLEVLKVKNYAFFGPTWTLEPEAGGFPCLKYLLIGTTNLQSWEADGTDHFPKLQHLVLMKCRLLKEIPYSIFVAPLLERIELHNCSETTVDLAKQLQKELLEDYGNESLVLHIA